MTENRLLRRPGAADEIKMSTQRQPLEAAIANLEAQRALLGNAVVEAALAPLRDSLAALAASAPVAPAEQTLKQVSVLFLDVVGSTALSRKLDPEDIHAILDGVLARCTAIVESHHGKVLQYAGDSLLAVFGADQSREDDAERAVHAGLALLAEGRAQSTNVAQQHAHADFNLRVGLHTGRVLLGGGVDAEHSIRGSTVHIAARMEQTAPPGALRISHDTYRHVRGVFDVEVQAPITVKGVDEPIATYLVQRAKPRAFRVATRGIEGVETRMIGRDAELEQLQDAFRRLCTERRFLAVTVVAEAGLGKSRLLYEFENWAEARPDAFYIFKGRAQPQSQSQPYGLLRDILAWRLQMGDGDSMEVAKQKFELGIAPLFAADDGDDMAQAHAHLLGHLIGLEFSESKHIRGIREDARQIRSRAFHAAAQMFRRVAAQDETPIVLMLDDLHWADDGSLDFLDYVGEVNRDVPMLVLGLARPALFERRGDWRRCDDRHLRIDLSALDRDHSRALADELLKQLPAIPDALRELLGGAEGNPFYMEELVKMLVDEGAIRTDEDAWLLEPDRLLATHVPQTLTGVLQARLDVLEPADKLALQQASVIGIVFWDQALAALDTNAVAALPSLVQRELITVQADTSLDGAREYAFRHQILHQVTYDTLLKHKRRECHAKTAAWLAAQSGAHALHFLGATAAHYEKAGDHVNAVEFFTLAAEHAAARFAYETAMREVSSALALMGVGQATQGALLRWRLVDVHERMLDLKGLRAEQLTDLDTLQMLADLLDDDRRRSLVQWRRSDLASRTADFHVQARTARLAMALAERAGDEMLRLIALDRLAVALANLGDTAAGKMLALDGLAQAQAKGLRRAEARFYNALSMIEERRGDVIAVLEADQYQLPIVRELGDRRSEAVNLANLGLSWLNLGDRAQARSYLEQGLRLMRALGDRTQEPYALVNLSQLALWQGDAASALAYAQSAVDNAIAVRDRLQEATALCWLGNAELALGRHARAGAAFESARTVALEIDHPQQHDAAAGLARVALAQDDVAQASLSVQGLLARLGDVGTLEGAEGPLLIQLTCHQVLARAGDPRAAAVLTTAHAELQARAAAISDPALRRNFLDKIPEHHEIEATWAAHMHPCG